MLRPENFPTEIETAKRLRRNDQLMTSFNEVYEHVTTFSAAPKMAKLMRCQRRTHQSLSSSNLFIATKQNKSMFSSKLHPVSRITTKNCISEMRTAAFQDHSQRDVIRA
ncbi:hypothetical protein Ddye_019152 [Dipteronia dyeriana]|uniref:Uncharacterized protein n=1 Tax=Dipteronia dyeriana TaxID=168575 RepID=A0AAD9TXL4_9ROSI|nr:hypothetical protein Ddye_019152 [Dipteronia dyeriana]